METKTAPTFNPCDDCPKDGNTCPVCTLENAVAAGFENRARIAALAAQLAEREEECARARTIADEAFGPLPVIGTAEALDYLEDGIFRQRQRVESAETALAAARARIAQLEAQLVAETKRADENVREFDRLRAAGSSVVMPFAAAIARAESAESALAAAHVQLNLTERAANECRDLYAVALPNEIGDTVVGMFSKVCVALAAARGENERLRQIVPVVDLNKAGEPTPLLLELAEKYRRSDDAGRVERVRKAIADWRSSWSGLGLREDAVDEIVRVMLAAANGR